MLIDVDEHGTDGADSRFACGALCATVLPRCDVNHKPIRRHHHHQHPTHHHHRPSVPLCFVLWRVKSIPPNTRHTGRVTIQLFLAVGAHLCCTLFLVCVFVCLLWGKGCREVLESTLHRCFLSFFLLHSISSQFNHSFLVLSVQHAHRLKAADSSSANSKKRLSF